MNLRKYLLTGGLASILILGACGDDGEEMPQETGGTEESSEAEDEQTSDDAEETVEESGESLNEDEEPDAAEDSEE